MQSKTWKLFKWKKCRKKKQKKREHVFKGYASIYNVDILNSFNPALQLKDTESAIKSDNKFVSILILVFKKIESEDQTNYVNFIRAQKQK